MLCLSKVFFKKLKNGVMAFAEISRHVHLRKGMG